MFMLYWSCFFDKFCDMYARQDKFQRHMLCQWGEHAICSVEIQMYEILWRKATIRGGFQCNIYIFFIPAWMHILAHMNCLKTSLEFSKLAQPLSVNCAQCEHTQKMGIKDETFIKTSSQKHPLDIKQTCLITLNTVLSKLCQDFLKGIIQEFSYRETFRFQLSLDHVVERMGALDSVYECVRAYPRSAVCPNLGRILTLVHF